VIRDILLQGRDARFKFTGCLFGVIRKKPRMSPTRGGDVERISRGRLNNLFRTFLFGTSSDPTDGIAETAFFNSAACLAVP
jgi:hypothetical protein